MTLNVLDKHYMVCRLLRPMEPMRLIRTIQDRDLTRTGNSIVMVSTSPGIFRVEEKLSKVTKQRMMDNGIGMDMIRFESYRGNRLHRYVLL